MSFEHHKVKDSEEHRLIVKMAVVDFEVRGVSFIGQLRIHVAGND